MQDALHRPPPPPRMGQNELGDLHPDDGIHGLCRTTDLSWIKVAADRGCTVAQACGSSTVASDIRTRYWTILGEAHRFRMLKAYAHRKVADALLHGLPPPNPEPIRESDLPAAMGYCQRMWGDYVFRDYLDQVKEAHEIEWGTYDRFTT